MFGERGMLICGRLQDDLIADKEAALTEAQTELDRLQIENSELTSDSAIGMLQTKYDETEKEREALEKERDELALDLEDTTEDRDNSANELKRIKNTQKKTLEDAVSTERAKTQEIQEELAELSEKHAQLNRRYEYLDDGTAEKDNEIFRIQARMDEMMQEVWGLADAVKEGTALKIMVKKRDEELKTTKKDMNAAVRQLNDLRLETGELRRRLGSLGHNAGEDDEGQAAPLFDLKLLKLKEQHEMERLRLDNQMLAEDNEKLEEDRLELKSKLRFSSSQRAQFALSMGLDAEQYSFLERMAERMREDGVRDMPLTDRSRELEDLLQTKDEQIEEVKIKLEASDTYGDEIKESVDEMREVIEGLFKENRELRSANTRGVSYVSTPAPAQQSVVVQRTVVQQVVQEVPGSAEPSAAQKPPVRTTTPPQDDSAVEPEPVTPEPAAERQPAKEKTPEQLAEEKTPPGTKPLTVDVGADYADSDLPDDDDDHDDESASTRPEDSSAPGTPLQRKVLEILYRSGLHQPTGVGPSGAAGPGVPDGAASAEIRKLKQQKEELMDAAMEASQSNDMGALTARVNKAEKEAVKQRKMVDKLKRALRKADLGVPYVAPMPTEAMLEARQAIAVEAAQSESGSTPAKPLAPAVEGTPAGTSKREQVETYGASYDDYVDLQTQLLDALGELELKEAELHQMEQVLAGSDRELTLVVDRQALLYREHMKSNQLWRERVQKQQNKMKDSEVQLNAAKLELQRYSDLDSRIAEAKSGLAEDSEVADKLKAQIMEMTRRATVLEVQEMLARRKAEYLEEAEGWLRTEFVSLRNEHIGMERELQTKVSNLESARQETESKLSENLALIKNSVPRADMDKLQVSCGLQLQSLGIIPTAAVG